jgi:hypothetical protein
MKSGVSKGRLYEAEVAMLFVDADFEVIENPKSAKPRQTDLYVRDGAVDFLIEVKNRKRKIDIGDIDALRSRLARVSADVVGIIITKSTPTKSAVAHIEADRSREILVFIDNEIESVRSRRQNVRALIERKRAALRVHGKAWFSIKRDLEFAESELPAGDLAFCVGQSNGSYFESQASFAAPLYAMEIPDTGWASLGGDGARLTIQLALSSVIELRDILGYLHKKFGLSRKGTFAISQRECCWYGSGADEFIAAIQNWRGRYNQSELKNFHHSEEIRYFDHFRNGWMELFAQQRVWVDAPRDSMLHQSELVIQIPGIPVNMLPFSKLCQYVGNEWAEFKYFSSRMTVTRRLENSLSIKVMGTVVRKADGSDLSSKRPVVVGVIAENPFYNCSSLPDELEKLEVPVAELAGTRLLLCSLKDWHGRGDIVDRYELQGIEATVGGAGGIIRPYGTWNKMLKRSSER